MARYISGDSTLHFNITVPPHTAFTFEMDPEQEANLMASGAITKDEPIADVVEQAETAEKE